MEDFDGAEAEVAESGGGERTTYCVTGCTGYIGSWLVKSLLQRGHKVHATARAPARCLHLLKLWSGVDRLRLFKADLQDEGSFDEPVKGCHGVFHVAASMQFSIPTKENIDEEKYVQENIIGPAIEGTLNVLKACLKAKTVKRVVFTSSISTLTAKDSSGNWRPEVDESCQPLIDHVWNTKAAGWVYVLSKMLSEDAAFQFAYENGIDLVSVITTTVAGPYLTSSVPSSIRVLLSPITGDQAFHQILSAVNSRMGSIALVHTEDICSGHIFVMQHPKAQGRYICCAQSCTMNELLNLLANSYPFTAQLSLGHDAEGSVPCEISSKKLRNLGFSYKYGLGDIMHQTVNCCVEHGFLPEVAKQ